MNVVRLSIGAGFSALVTFGLFVLMYTLIETGDKELDEKPTRKLADIHMPDTEIQEHTRPPKPDKPEKEDEQPPEPEVPEMEDIDIDVDNVIDMTPPSSKVKLNLKGGIGASDGEYLPMVKVAPIYPRRAQTRGIQGYCTVEYTVTKTGATRDPIPVDCSPKGIFERASVKAALKFKYKPRVVDGEAIEGAGVQNKFTYELEK